MVAQPLATDTMTDHTAEAETEDGKVVPFTPRRSYRWLQGSSPLPAWATDLEWIARYGRALPLVAYMATRVDWDTGVVREYSHNQAAEATAVTPGAVAQQFRLLRQSGVVTVLRRRKYSLDIQMAPSVGYCITTTQEYQKIDTLDSTPQVGGPDCQKFDTLAAPEYQKKHARVSKKSHSLSSNTLSGKGIDSLSPRLPTLPATQGAALADAAEEPVADTLLRYPWEEAPEADTTPAPPAPPAKGKAAKGKAAKTAKPATTATTAIRAAKEPTVYGPPAGWPERSPGESREKFYSRAVQAAGKKWQPALAYVASIELGVPNTSETIARLAKLATQVKRYGLVLKAILEAQDCDSDALDYVTKTAWGLAAKEAAQQKAGYTPGAARGPQGQRLKAYAGSPAYWAEKARARKEAEQQQRAKGAHQ